MGPWKFSDEAAEFELEVFAKKVIVVILILAWWWFSGSSCRFC